MYVSTKKRNLWSGDSASEMTNIVSGGALNSTRSLRSGGAWYNSVKEVRCEKGLF